MAFSSGVVQLPARGSAGGASTHGAERGGGTMQTNRAAQYVARAMGSHSLAIVLLVTAAPRRGLLTSSRTGGQRRMPRSR
eukprot:1936632-Pyramimonas_sp.AAC.1